MQHYVNVICDKNIDTSGKLDESIFPNIEQNISSQGVRVITIPLERELIQKEADNYANLLANCLLEAGLEDFDIEISTSNEIEEEETYEGNEFYEEYETMHFNEDQIDEAEYQGRKVSLGKPMRGDVKKFKVFVKKPNGNVVKVNFGDPNMRIKKSNPKRRKSFRARHNCANPGPRHKARYWSCRNW
jgi:hypothetical protein|tara:strand:- start:2163 stop:2723 length:561 start_codon:yes stop_codon:yes gene_type:complete